MTVPIRRRAHPLSSVVLVGRPNVGKSTLFNRIIGSRRSIVTPIPGTTRDAISGETEWAGHHFMLTDTGGMFGASDDPLHQLVVDRGQKALAGADVVVVVVDGVQGLVAGDWSVAAAARQSGATVVLAVNKIDDRRSRDRASEFTRLGISPCLEIAAEHGTDVADLLDAIVGALGLEVPPAARAGVRKSRRRLREEPGPQEAATLPTPEPGEIRIAIVGRPNVGKSSLLNRLLREERVLVNDAPGTTRDAVDAMLTWHGRRLRLIDTAGMRRPGRVGKAGPLESLSVLLAKRSIERADVVVLVVDATAGAVDQDAAIAGEAARTGCGVVVAANKWDLMKSSDSTVALAFDEGLRRQLKFLHYASIVHISALTGAHTDKLLQRVVHVQEERRRRVSTGELNRFVERVTQANPPVGKTKQEMRILYATQSGVEPPTFVFFTNVAGAFHFSYERYLENRLREAFGFEGTPLRLQVRRRGRARN